MKRGEREIRVSSRNKAEAKYLTLRDGERIKKKERKNN